MYESLGKLVLYLLGDATSYTKMIKDAKGQFQSMTVTVSKAGASLGLAIAKPLLEIATNSVQAAASFERSMATIVGLVGVSRNQVEAWTQDLLTIGPKFGKSAEELAHGLYYITSSGFRGSKAMDILNTASMAAAAGLGTVKEVSFAVVSALNAYHDSGMDAVAVTDMITAAAREGHMEAADLARVLGSTLPLASAMKLPLQDLLAGVASLTRVGASPSQAIIGIQGVLKNFLKPTVAATKALEGVGLSFETLRDMIKKPGGILQALMLLHNAMDKEGDFGGGIAGVFGEIRPLRAALGLLMQDGEEISHIFEAVGSAGGSTQKAFDAISNTAAFKFDQMVEQVKSTLITLGGVLSPVVVSVTDEINNAFKGITEGIGETKNISQLKTLFSTIKDKATELWEGIKGVATKAWNETMQALGTDWDTLKENFKRSIGVLAAAIDDLDVKRIVKGIQDLVDTIRDFIRENKGAIASIVALAAGLYLGYEAVVVVIAGVNILVGILAALKVGVILNTAVWLLWNGAIITVNAGMLIYGATVFAVNAIIKLIELTLIGINIVMSMQAIQTALVTLTLWLYDAAVIAVNIVINILAGRILLTTTLTWLYNTSLAAIKTATWLWNAAVVVTKGLITSLKVLIAASIITVWLWYSTVTLADAATWLWNIAVSAITLVYTTFQAILTSGSLATVFWTAVTYIATAATWLWNAALTVLNLLISPVELLAAAVAIVAIAAAFVLVASVTWGAWKAIEAVFLVLADFPTTYGPIAHIGGLFQEWYDIIKDVIRAAQSDLPLAWQIMKKGFELAVNQMKDMWPPLWNFIQNGFEILWDLTAQQFKLGMVEALLAFLAKGGGLFGSLFADEIKTMQEDTTKGMKLNIDIAKQQLKNAAKDFKVIDSDETKKTREELDKLRNSIPSGKGRIGDAWSEDLKKIPKLAAETANTWNNTIKESIKPLDAVLFGSAEARSRINDFMALLRGDHIAKSTRGAYRSPTRNNAQPAPVIFFGNNPRVAAGYNTAEDRSNELLEKILVTLQQGNKEKINNGVEVIPLDIA